MTSPAITKRCSSCKKELHVDLFYRERGMPTARCKECQKAASAAYVARHPERRRATSQRSRFRKILRAHGMTEERFDAMVVAQGGRCAVCEDPTERLEIDHDHVTGRVRGLLCPECNKALGLLFDDVAVLQRAVRYLS